MRRTSYFLAIFCAAMVMHSTARADLDDETPAITTPEPAPLRPPDEKVMPAPPAPNKEPSKISPAKSEVNKKRPGSNNVQRTRTTPGDSDGQKQPVKWTSKGLRATKDRGVLELNQDVVVTQGDLQLKANKAKVFYEEKINNVNKVVVTGNVKITKSSDDPAERITGIGNEGVFHNADRKVVLRGNAQLIRGEDVLRGKQITYELDTGWISVDNVEGVMQPGDNKKP